jgi:hypothetical protein
MQGDENEGRGENENRTRWNSYVVSTVLYSDNTEARVYTSTLGRDRPSIAIIIPKMARYSAFYGHLNADIARLGSRVVYFGGRDAKNARGQG